MVQILHNDCQSEPVEDEPVEVNNSLIRNLQDERMNSNLFHFAGCFTVLMGLLTVNFGYLTVNLRHISVFLRHISVFVGQLTVFVGQLTVFVGRLSVYLKHIIVNSGR